MPLDADRRTDLPDDQPEGDRLFDLFRFAASTADIMRLVAGTPDADLDGLEVATIAKLAEAEDDEREALQGRLDDQASQALADRLIVWVRTLDWDASQVFLQEYTTELLTETAAASLTLLHLANVSSQ